VLRPASLGGRTRDANSIALRTYSVDLKPNLKNLTPLVARLTGPLIGALERQAASSRVKPVILGRSHLKNRLTFDDGRNLTPSSSIHKHWI